MSDGLTLGIDLGTSALKVLLLDAQGQRVGEGEAGFPTRSDQPQQAEQSPQDWLAAAADAMVQLRGQLASEVDWPARVGAIGLTGQLPTLVCLGADGPLGAAITWRDGRADGLAAERITPRRRREIYDRTGMPIDGRYLAPMLARHFGERLGEVRLALSAKDFLLWALTGIACTEPSTAAGYGLYDLTEQRFSTALARDWQTPLELLPPVRDSNGLAGPLDERGARLLGLRTGIPVSTGAADSVCAAYALSGLDEQCASISLGTSAVVVGATRQLQFDRQARCLVTPHVQPGWYGREMDLMATGSGHQWLSQLFDWRHGELDARAARSLPGARGLLFPPYLAGGEQGALWNPALKAGLFGLTLAHSADDIARAYLEGVCFELRRCVDVLAEQSPVRAVAVSGNITKVPSSAQLLADILGRPVRLASQKSPAAQGAASLAGTLAGLGGPMPSALMVELPPGGQAAAYADLYARYCERAALCA